MLILSWTATMLLLTFLYMYFGQYVKLGYVVWWSLPIVMVVTFLMAFLAFVLIVCIVPIFIKPKDDRQRNFYRRVTNFAAQFVLQICGVDIVVKHPERLPEGNEKFLLVKNHQSNIDPIAFIWTFRKKHIVYVMKDNIMKAPMIGRWLYGAGFLPLNRTNNRKAINTINTAVDRITSNQHIIGIFPEGTRSKGPDIGNFRPGALKIAKKANCPIVVCTIDNAYKIKFKSFFKRIKVMIEIVKVIRPEDYKDMSTIEISNMCRDLIIKNIEKRRGQYEWLEAKSKEELEQEWHVGHYRTKHNKNKKA